MTRYNTTNDNMSWWCPCILQVRQDDCWLPISAGILYYNIIYWHKLRLYIQLVVFGGFDKLYFNYFIIQS